MKKRLLSLLAACLLLTGCGTEKPALTPAEPADTVAIPIFAEETAIAPIGDAGLAYSAVAPLYLPSADGQQLLAVYEALDFTYSLHPAETILRALLAHPGNDRVRPVSATEIVPAGSDPVEVAGDVATVNLSPAALEIPRQELHTVCRAIAATLCELPDVTYVNVLVSGKPVSMDDAGYLPLGSVTAQPGQALPVMWEMLQASRTPESELPSATPISAVATLYFPLADGSGVIPETRQLSFAGQHPQQLVLGLIDALSSGPDGLKEASDVAPLNQLMIATPEITTLPDGSLRVTLRFTGDLRGWIEAAGADPACAYASIVCTLTTFVPRLQEVCIYTGERPLTSAVARRQGSRLFPGGIHERSGYTGYLMAQTHVYHPAGSTLEKTSAPLPYRSIYSPRALLLALAEDSAVIPGAISDADILGLSVSGDTLLINLSARCADALRQHPEEQRLTAYAIVNTLCEGLGVKRVRFFFGSEVVSGLGGSLVWSGEFLHNPGLIR